MKPAGPPPPPGALATAALAGAALVGFAANSLLCRLALGTGAIDPASFTSVRLVAGAVVLAVLARALRAGGEGRPSGASLASALALLGYAVAFSYAYVRVGAGVGALVLFASVQATMIGAGVAAGERPRAAEWAGMAVALGGLAVLAFPGLDAPDPLGVGLMTAAGIAWGVYSLRGRGTERPLAATAGNFARTVPLVAAILALSFASSAAVHASARGLALAAASGALASGIGYAFWYAALRGLTATRAAVAQLAVPALAATGGVLILGETVTARLVAGGSAVLGGVALAVLRRPGGGAAASRGEPAKAAGESRV